MKKKNLLLITVTAIGLLFAGCQSNQEQSTSVQENQVSASSQMEAAAPKSDDDSTVTTSVPSSDTSKDTSSAAKVAVTEEDAKKIALKDAGIKEKEITNIRVEKDTDDGRQIYEVDFYVENKEFDYDIDMNTGEILSRDYEIEDDFMDIEQYNAEFSTDKFKGIISQEEAINTVLKRVNGATKQNVQIELDNDDGHQIYEGEIHYNNMEYDFELNAENGQILEWSEDREDD